MSNSRNTSPHQYSPSYRYPNQIINLELVMDAIFRREDAGAAIMTLNGDPLLFSEFCFLDFLFQQIRRHEQDLEWERQIACYRIQRILARDSSTQLYEWVIRRILQSPRSSRHSSPYRSNYSPSSFSSQRPLPIPPPRWRSPTPIIPIRTSPTVTEARRWQWRRDFLWEDFPEDPIEGSRENPIVIDVSDFEDWYGVSIDVREVMLQFFYMSSSYHPHLFCYLFYCHSLDMFHFFIPPFLDVYFTICFTSCFIPCFIPYIGRHSHAQYFPLLLDTCYVYIYSFLLVYKLLRSIL